MTTAHPCKGSSRPRTGWCVVLWLHVGLRRTASSAVVQMQTEDYSNWLSWLLWSATNYRSLDRQELIACPTYLHGAPAPHGLTALTED